MRQCTLLIVLQSTFMKRLFNGDGFNKLQPRLWGTGRSVSRSKAVAKPLPAPSAAQAGRHGSPRCQTPSPVEHIPRTIAKPAWLLARSPTPLAFRRGSAWPPQPGHNPEPATEMENAANPSAICAFAAFPLRHLTPLQTACPHALGLISFCYTLWDVFHSKPEVWEHFLCWTCFLPFDQNLWLVSYQVWIFFYYFTHRIIHSGSMNIRNYHTVFCAPFAEHMDNCCLPALAPLQGSEQTCNISI